ncbi:hypothetical protein H0X48_02730 [Candidatus Dependentiae bacterium]|nr:hypothetical protein [Candidatus Dependentiae bacterium]
MHNYISIFLLVISLGIAVPHNCRAQDDLTLTFSVSDLKTNKKSAMKLLLGVINPTQELAQVAQELKKALERSKQFSVLIEEFGQLSKTQDIKALSTKGYSLAVFINAAPGGQAIQWRLYDTLDATMIKGKEALKQGNLVRGWAYAVADELWPELTQQQGSFGTKIAYTKRKQRMHGKMANTVYMCDADGSHEAELLSLPGTYVGLYWHNDPDIARLFCSEFTRFNVRLIGITPHQPKKVVLDLTGTCVGISLAPESDKAIYCRSGDIWHYSFNRKNKKSAHTCLIKNDGKNSSPTLLANGDIIFCSDAKKIRQGNAQARGPQICYYHNDTGESELLTKDGYCVGPAYSSYTDKVAYSKKVNGIMQLFVYSIKTKKHEQVTFDKGNKIDCSWSPCGQYLVFCYQDNALSRIATLHVATRQKNFITPVQEYCAYPAWSPRYTVFPS